MGTIFITILSYVIQCYSTYWCAFYSKDSLTVLLTVGALETMFEIPLLIKIYRRKLDFNIVDRTLDKAGDEVNKTN
jgi:hypothetical protein